MNSVLLVSKINYRGALALNFFTTLELGFAYVYTAGIIILGLAIFFLYKRSEEKYLLYFTFFSLFTLLSNLINISYFYIKLEILYPFYAVFIIFEGYYLLKAVFKYFNLEFEKLYFDLLKFLLSFTVLSSFSLNRFVIFAPALLYLAAAFFKAAVLFFDKGFNKFLKIVGTISIAVGIIELLLPYLRANDLISEYAIFIKGGFSLIFGISIFAIYYEDLQYKLKIREKQYHKLFNQSPAGMLLMNRHGEILTVNDAVSELTGYSKEELEGKSIFNTLVPTEFKIRAKENIKDLLNGEDKDYIMKTYDKDNNLKYFLTKETKFIQPDYSTAILSMRVDYTDYKTKEEEIRYLSYHDNLTDLYNRTFMEEEMQRLNSSRVDNIAVIMIDVNGLKLFNDTFGHKKGDELLIKTAQLLKESTRNSDLVARWAGDEFVIVLPHTGEEEMNSIVSRIKNNAEQTYDSKIMISIAVGAALQRNQTEDLYAVFDEADEKMYEQKMEKSRKTKRELIEKILVRLEEKSTETKAHRRRMKNKAADFADYLRLKQNEKTKLLDLAEMHDIGKISISKEILMKKESLNDAEWKKVKDHPEISYKIAAASKEFAFVAKELLHHHESWDGSGYPDGLKGERIPYLARIIAIIDAYDVMINKNLYNKKMSQKKAREEIKKEAGIQFDPDLAEKFIEFLDNS